MRIFSDKLIMTPGPTEVPERIRLSMIRRTTNPDLDPEFMRIYRETIEMINRLIGVHRSSTETFVMIGEAMLGLESAIANIISERDKVIVVANGVFGEGFADLVKSYGGEPVLVAEDENSWRRSIDLSTLERVLEKNRDAVAMTLVHCDTPSALLNDLEAVAKLAREFGVLLIVDAVSTIGATPIRFDDLGIDVLIGGSQKALNAPAGMTIISVSERAWERIERKRYSGYYMNLLLWRDYVRKGIFPYTMSEPLIYSLNEALKLLLEEGLDNVYKRHLVAREASWRAAEALGLELYPAEIKCSCPTVTAFLPPKGLSERSIRDIMWNRYGVMIAGSWGRLEGRVLRIGHMGVQASKDLLMRTYVALANTLRDLGMNVSIQTVVSVIESSYEKHQ